MNKFPVLIVTLAALSSVPLAAQQPGKEPGTAADGGSPAQTSYSAASPSPDPQHSSAPAVPVSSTANSPEISNPQLRPVTGELENKLDTSSAKTGDSVVIKTIEKASTAQGVVIPKGSRIVGHVTDVEAKGKSGDNSRLTVQFDQAELKGGQTMPIKSVLQSLEPAQGSAPADGYAANSAPAAPSAGSAQQGGDSGSPAAPHPATGPATSPATGPATGPATSPATSSPTAGAPQAGTVVARNGNVAIRTTAIPGVLLAANADGQPFTNASGALLGAKRDVHLDTGTHVVVAIAEENSKNIR